MKKILFLGLFLVLSTVAFGQEIQEGVLLERLKAHINVLTSDSIEGRLYKSVGGEKASRYIGDFFKKTGLQVEGIYNGNDGVLKNVVGYVAGSDSSLSKEIIVIGAHFDHVGRSKDGQINRGANDNASGTAVMMELAKIFKENPTKRPIMFVGFDGEEKGLLGSNAFCENWKAVNGDMVAMFNFDMAGSFNNENRIRIEGTNSIVGADSIARVITPDVTKHIKPYSFAWGYMTDCASFLANMVPAIYISTFPKSNIHSPADSQDIIDYEGMVKLVRFSHKYIREIVNGAKIEMDFDLVDNFKEISMKDQEGIDEIKAAFLNRKDV